jgi:NOL1/NOP2/fmu family ribosome biogenesis protein
MPACRGIKILTAGIEVATVCKNRLEPAHGVFLASHGADCIHVADLPLSDPRLDAYLHGQEIAFTGENGWTAVAVAGLPVGFGKCTGNRLKNRYPKGLRLL